MRNRRNFYLGRYLTGSGFVSSPPSTLERGEVVKEIQISITFLFGSRPILERVGWNIS